VIIHLSITIFEFKYSIIGSLLSLIVHPEAERSAEASDISKACSTLRFGRPSTSRHLPEKMFFLPYFCNELNALVGWLHRG